MQQLTLAYRDDDRLPVILAIREMARRHYDLDVKVVCIKGGEAYEASLFNGAADILIEHLEYLYDEAKKGRKVMFFCAPSKGGGLDLVAPQGVHGVEEFRGKKMAVRSHGQPHAVTLWLRMLGLDRDVETVIVHDKEVGRWGQWKKVVSGECIATFMSPLYMPDALNAGLKILPVPEIPIVGHFAAFRRDAPRFLLKTARHYGDVAYFRLGKQNTYLFSHPDAIRDVLVTVVWHLCYACTHDERRVARLAKPHG